MRAIKHNTLRHLLPAMILMVTFLFCRADGYRMAHDAELPHDTVIMDRAGDSVLWLRFPLTADMSRRWCSQYRVTATPMLCDTAGNSLLLKPSVFAGKKNIRFNSRLLKLGIIDSLPQASDIRDTVIYDTLVVVPAAMYASCPSLYMDRLEEGCNRSNRMPDELIATLDCNTAEPDKEPDAEPDNESDADPDGIIPVFRPISGDADTPVDDAHPANRKMVAGIVPIDRYERFDPSIPLMADPHAVYIAYPYDNSVIDSAFAENTLALSIIDEMVQILNRDDSRYIAKVRIIGSASVEGKEMRNISLSQHRAEALRQYLLDKYSVPFDDIEVIAAGEAWADFRADVAATDISLLPERDKLLEIIDSDATADDKEKHLKLYNGGKPWKYISEHLLPRQRVAGFIKIYYRKAE